MKEPFRFSRVVKLTQTRMLKKIHKGLGGLLGAFLQDPVPRVLQDDDGHVVATSFNCCPNTLYEKRFSWSLLHIPDIRGDTTATNCNPGFAAKAKARATGRLC
jgi:hypothetical protein